MTAITYVRKLVVLTASASICMLIAATLVRGQRRIQLRSDLGLPASSTHSLGASSADSRHVFSATREGLMASQDGGRSWSRIRVRDDKEEILSVAVHPSNSAVLLVGRRDGLWRTSDHGKTWRRVASLRVASLVPLAISFAPANPSVIYMTTARHGAYRSSDSGNTWHRADKGLPTGFTGTTDEFRSLVVDPRDKNLVYVAHARHGVYRTTDGGATWDPISEPLSRIWVEPPFTPLLAADPQRPGRVFLVVGERVHSHLIRTHVWMTSLSGRWVPTEIELPDAIVVDALTVDRDSRMLRVWSESGIFEFSLAAIPEPID